MFVNDLIALCANHLREEENLLSAALPLVGAVREAFLSRDWQALADTERRDQEFGLLIDDLRERRRQLRDEISARLQLAPNVVSLPRVLAGLPPHAREPLQSQLANVRRLANELVAANHWLAVHFRIHLDAYQRLLRDITGAAGGSGRYGPAGKAETPAYRPLLEITG